MTRDTAELREAADLWYKAEKALDVATKQHQALGTLIVSLLPADLSWKLMPLMRQLRTELDAAVAECKREAAKVAAERIALQVRS